MMLSHLNRSLLRAAATLILSIVCLPLLSSVTAQQGGLARYLYDDNGRLHAVITPAGEAAVYDYDAAGNVTSIRHFGVTDVSVIDFTPRRGAIGTSVTIYGTGFSTTAGANTVKFNGITATITSVTATQMIVTVPPGATTGLINVTTPSGTATSTNSFTVDSGDVEFTGRMNIGETITVTVTIPNKVAIVNFDATAGQRVSLLMSNATIPVIPGCPSDVFIINPDGKTKSASGCLPPPGANGFIDTISLLANGTYTIKVAPNFGKTGSVTLTLYSVPADATATIIANGTPVTLTTTTPGQNAKAIFNGTMGQQVSVMVSNVTTPGPDVGAFVYILKPDGQVLGADGGGFAATFAGPDSTQFIDAVTLPTTDTYQIYVNPRLEKTGSVTLTLYSVPADATATISANGTPVTVTTITLGQNVTATFSGTMNQRVFLLISNVTLGPYNLRITYQTQNGGVTLASADNVLFDAYMDARDLPATGTYTIKIDPLGSQTGSVTFTLYTFTDFTSTINTDGTPVQVTTTTPGQNAVLSFNAVAGQRLSLAMSNVTGGPSLVTIRTAPPNPQDEKVIAALYPVNPPEGFIAATPPLAIGGPYKIVVDPTFTATVSLSLSLYNVPPDITGTITPGGDPVPVSITTPGQQATLTFAGSMGHRMSLVLSNVTIGASSCCGSNVSINNNTSTNALIVGQDVGTDPNTWFIETNANGLPTTDTYNIKIKPKNANTGAMTLNLYDVPADVTNTVTVGGPSVGITTTVPGQNGLLTFNGTSGQQVTVRIANNALGTVKVELYGPPTSAGTPPPLLTSMQSSSSGFNLSTQTLSTTGAHTIRIDPSGSSTGSLNVSVTSP